MHLLILHSHTLCWMYLDKDNYAINHFLTKHNFHLSIRPVGNPSNPSSWRPVEFLNDPLPTCFYFYLLWRLSTNGLLKLITDKFMPNKDEVSLSSMAYLYSFFGVQCVWLSVCLKLWIQNFIFYLIPITSFFPRICRISFLFLYLRFFFCKKKNTNFTNLHEIKCFGKYFCY